MYAPHGATHDSNRGRNKDGGGALRGRGIARYIRYLTLFIPNYNAKHRYKGNGLVMRYEWNYIQNRYYAHYRPMVRKLLKKLRLRK